MSRRVVWARPVMEELRELRDLRRPACLLPEVPGNKLPGAELKRLPHAGSQGGQRATGSKPTLSRTRSRISWDLSLEEFWAGNASDTMYHGAPVPSVRAQSRLTGPFQGQSSEWPMTDDINANATSTKTTPEHKHTNTSTSTSTHMHTLTHAHHLNAQAQSLARHSNAPFFPLFAIASSRHHPKTPDPSCYEIPVCCPGGP